MSLLNLILSYTTTLRAHHVARPATRVITVAGYDENGDLLMQNGKALTKRFTCDANTTFKSFQTEIYHAFGINPKAQRFANLLVANLGTARPTCEIRSHRNTPATEKMFNILAAESGDKVIQVFKRKQEWSTVNVVRYEFVGIPQRDVQGNLYGEQAWFVCTESTPKYDLGDGAQMIKTRKRCPSPHAADYEVAAWT